MTCSRCHWVSDTLHKRKGQIHVSGFSLLGMTIVMACVFVLLASLFLAREVAKARTHCYPLKSKGKGIWNAIRVANSEREPLGKSSLWPADVEDKYASSSEKYFQYLLSDGKGTAQDVAEDRLVEDLSFDSFSAQGITTAASASDFTKDHMAWRVAKVNESTPGELPFIVTKNTDGTDFSCSGPDDEGKINLNDEKPFGNKRAVWITIGGASKDARKKYYDNATLFGGYATNSFEILSM